MTCEQAINYLYSRLKFGSVPGLERIAALCELLGNPQDKLKFIHVAGTNGKGSVCTMMSRMLINAGYKTGLYTSPYVMDFRERMQINGEMIPEDELGALMDEIKPKVEELDKKGITPTEFEVLTSLAFLYYYRNNCDIVVLEVGLGGLCDSTNIIKPPELSIIMSISYDHTNILGKTIEEIAFQKSGIIKDGSPVVLYPQIYPQARSIIKNTAEAKHCKLYEADKSKIEIIKSDIFGSEFMYGGIKISVSLIGSQQILNAATAFEAGRALQERGYRLTDENILHGIKSAKIAARTQIVSKEPLIVIDGGHNVDGINALCDNLKNIFSDYGIIAVIGMLKDKDVDTSVKMLAPMCKKMITVTIDNPRSMSAEELKDKIMPYCADVTAVANSAEAFNTAKKELAKGDMLLVCGSLYLASEIEK